MGTAAGPPTLREDGRRRRRLGVAVLIGVLIVLLCCAGAVAATVVAPDTDDREGSRTMGGPVGTAPAVGAAGERHADGNGAARTSRWNGSGVAPPPPSPAATVPGGHRNQVPDSEPSPDTLPDPAWSGLRRS